VWGKFRRFITSGPVITCLIAFVVAGIIGLIRHQSVVKKHAAQVAARMARCHASNALNSTRRDPAPVSAGRTRVVVLGDGLAQGAGLPAPRADAWTTLVGRHEHWYLIVNADGGTGILNGGYCGHESYPRRVAAVLAAHPRLVVVDAGSGDVALVNQYVEKKLKHPAARLAGAERRLLAALHPAQRVVVIGPVLPPAAKDGKALRLVDKALKKAALHAGDTFIATATWQLAYQPHTKELSAAGERQFAVDLEHALTSTG
jgi:lysophospholipase L1-like esterase